MVHESPRGEIPNLIINLFIYLKNTNLKYSIHDTKVVFPLAVCIFADPTEASNGKEIEASDWSNLHFDEPPPKSKNM